MFLPHAGSVFYVPLRAPALQVAQKAHSLPEGRHKIYPDTQLPREKAAAACCLAAGKNDLLSSEYDPSGSNTVTEGKRRRI